MMFKPADHVRAELPRAGLLGPAAFDIGDDLPDLRIGKLIGVARHLGAFAAFGKDAAAELDVIEDLPVGMLPGMSRLVLRRGGGGAVGAARFPSGLALEIGA